MAESPSGVAFLPVDLASEQGVALLQSVAARYGDAIVQAAGSAERLFLLRSP
jgi:hypothetical protein